MTTNILKKGVSVSLRGANTLQSPLVGYGWKVNEGQWPSPLDVDGSAVVRDAQGVVLSIPNELGLPPEILDKEGRVSVVSYYAYAQPNTYGLENPFKPYLFHGPDNTTGEGEGYDEWIIANLDLLVQHLPTAMRIDYYVNMYDNSEDPNTKRPYFGLVEGASVGLLDAAALPLDYNHLDDSMLRSPNVPERQHLDITNNDAIYDLSAIVFVSLIRGPHTWELLPVCHGKPEWSDLSSFVNATVTEAELRALANS